MAERAADRISPLATLAAIVEELRLCLSSRDAEIARTAARVWVRLNEELGRLDAQLKRGEAASVVVRAADRYCRCLAEFDQPQYCSEWLEALDKALLEYAVYEADRAQGDGE